MPSLGGGEEWVWACGLKREGLAQPVRTGDLDSNGEKQKYISLRWWKLTSDWAFGG